MERWQLQHMIEGLEEEIRYAEIMRHSGWAKEIRKLLERIAEYEARATRMGDRTGAAGNPQ